MNFFKWLLHSPVPTIGALFISCLVYFKVQLDSSIPGNTDGQDLLAGTFPNLSSALHWCWIVTGILFTLYAVIGKYIRTRW